MPLIEDIVAMESELTTWRRDIHAHPELGFEENRTADFVAEKLEEENRNYKACFATNTKVSS